MVLISQDDEKKLLFWLIYHVLLEFNQFECFLFLYIMEREFQGDICPLALYIEIISLVSKALKLLSKLTSRVCQARVLIADMEIFAMGNSSL